MAERNKPASLVDDVLSRAARSTPGFAPWYERLPPEAVAELEAVRAAFNPAVHQKKTYAKAIISAFEERGWSICGPQGVINWLDGKH